MRIARFASERKSLEKSEPLEFEPVTFGLILYTIVHKYPQIIMCIVLE